MKSFSQAHLHTEAFMVSLQDGQVDGFKKDVRTAVNFLPTTNMYIMNKPLTSENKGRISSPLDARLRRLRANDRERRRIQSINGAMEALRRVIPDTQNNRKVTKLQLLKLAQDYIKYLSEVLQATESSKTFIINPQMDISSATCNESFVANCV